MNKRLYRYPLSDRLMARRTEAQSGCWEYAGSRTADGYGQITVDGITRRVHRVAYELYVGPIPEGRLVRHTCDNPACFNPEHLTTGTDRDNVADAIQRGRKALGSSCYMYRLWNQSWLCRRYKKENRMDARSVIHRILFVSKGTASDAGQEQKDAALKATEATGMVGMQAPEHGKE